MMPRTTSASHTNAEATRGAFPSCIPEEVGGLGGRGLERDFNRDRGGLDRNLLGPVVLGRQFVLKTREVNSISLGKQ